MRGLYLLPLLCLLALPAAAQTDIIIHAGFAGPLPEFNTPLTRLVDLDGNGTFETATELFAFQKKYHSLARKNCFVMGMDTTIEGGRLVFYGADSGDAGNGECYVFRSVDMNGDGIIQDTETAIFADLGLPTSNYAPDAVAVIKDSLGRSLVYVTSDAPGIQGIWRCQDLNGDGDALDPGEAVNWATPASGLSIGPVVLSMGDFNQIRAGHQGRVLAYNNSDPAAIKNDSYAWLGFSEDPFGRPVASNFFNPSAANQLTRNPDFASGAIVDVDLWYNNVPVGDMVWLCPAKGAHNGQDAYFLATYSKPGGKYGNTNKAGQVISGLILLGTDLNSDGDINDSGEVRVWFNGTGAAVSGGVGVGQVQPVTYFDHTGQIYTNTCPGIDGIAVQGRTVYIAYEPTAGAVALLEIRDANNNQVIETGEVRQVMHMLGPDPNFYSTKFGCDVRGIIALPGGMLADPQPVGSAPYGEGCIGSNGLRPLTWSRGGSPLPGNTSLAIHLSRGAENTPGIFLLGSSNQTFPGLGSLPAALDVLGMPGCSLYTNLLLSRSVILDARGRAQVALPVPNQPSLQGVSVYGQFLILDQAANAAGVVATDGLEITVQ